jgi:hypothetical protein
MHRLARLAELLRSHQTRRAATHHNNWDFKLHGTPTQCLGMRQRNMRWQFFLYRS